MNERREAIETLNALILSLQERIRELEKDLRPAQLLLEKYSVEIMKLEEENARLRKGQVTFNNPIGCWDTSGVEVYKVVKSPEAK